MPPEAIDGRDEDFRSDLYAFGATLYHALAGKPPCSEETMATARLREAKKRVVPLDQAAPWLGMETCAVIDRAMAYDPGGRFRSYEELISALQSALRHAESAAARQPPPTSGHPAGSARAGRMQRRSKSRRIAERVGMGIGMLAVVAAIGFGVWWINKPDADDSGSGNGNAGSGDGNQGKQPPDDDKASTNPDAGVKIGRDYAAARNALVGKNYPDAEARFAALLGMPKVPEPTATLAGVESAIAALLDGRSSDARVRAAAVSKHVSGLDPSSDSACRVLGAAADLVADLKPDPPAETPPGTPAELAAALLLALKNWEQGCHQQAVGWFEQVAASAAGDDEWASVYRKLAENYLADHKVLTATDYDTLPDTISGCEEFKIRLDDGLKQLQTRGRAAYNLRQRQLQLARQARDLQRAAVKDAPPEKSESLADLLPEIDKLVAEGMFEKAVERLKGAELKAEEDLLGRSAWVYLIESSSTFIADLAKDLAAGAAGVKVSTKDGAAAYDRVAGVGKTGLQLAAGAGAPVEVAWGAIAPADLITLHQLVVRNESNPLEKARRHEQAIAYQFLAGDRESAVTAAGRLAESSPAFRQRWSEAMKAFQL